MNWRTAWLRTVAWQLAWLGAVSGLWGALAYEGTQNLIVGLWGPGPGFVPALLPGTMCGLMLGLLLASLDEFLGHFPRRMLRTAASGAGIGALAGVAALGPLGALVPVAGGTAAMPLLDAPLVHWTLLGPALGVVAAAAALASGVAIGQARLGLHRAACGFAGGALCGGVLAGAFAWLPANAWLHAGGLTLWGSATALAIHWREKRWARRWLRVLTAPGEDRILPLRGREIRLGKLESNEIALPFYQEIHPVHCHMHWTGESYQIVDDETGGTVLVNFRQVQEQVLKSGDLVKIGSALLQYGEAT